MTKILNSDRYSRIVNDPMVIENCRSSLDRCGFLLIVGTSAQVYPARYFIQMAKLNDKPVLSINLEPSDPELADY
ncbi:MAG: hypothetical protein F6K24_57275, partial [Okeania sp. SIO2D1]|nr:hypothetical protein [Okeania sp. SIO2D1]